MTINVNFDQKMDIFFESEMIIFATTYGFPSAAYV